MPKFDDADYRDAVTIRDRVLSLLADVANGSVGQRRVRSPYSCPLRYRALDSLPWQLDVWYGAVKLMRFEWSDQQRGELKAFLKPTDWVERLLRFGLPEDATPSRDHDLQESLDRIPDSAPQGQREHSPPKDRLRADSHPLCRA
jgi:hypothetical protein